MASMLVATTGKDEEEVAKRNRRATLRDLNRKPLSPGASKALDSSLKRHTALTKRMRQSIGVDNREQTLRDIDSLALEKYIEEIVSSIAEGAGKCKTEKDVWSAVEIISALHRRFPTAFTPSLIALFSAALAPPPKQPQGTLTAEQREKDDSSRVLRQRPVLRVCSELALVGIINDAPGKSGAEWIMKALKDLLSNDPSLSSLPLLLTFLKSYSRPYLGLTPPSQAKQQATEPPQTEGSQTETDGVQADVREEEELVETEMRDRFKRMCEGYFDSVCKKLVKEHRKLQEQDHRNHEAYIRSGEIFEDRQNAYEKMTKGYEKLLSSCQSLSELLYLPLPILPSSSSQSASILLLDGSSSRANADNQDDGMTIGKWEDEEERRFYEDIADLRDFVPKSVLGVDEVKDDKSEDSPEAKSKKEEEEVLRLEAEMKDLAIEAEVDDTDHRAHTPIPSPPRSPSPTTAPGPSQLLTTLLARLPDATNRSLIDQAAVDFAFLNSKAARKRLIKFLFQVPKNRTDLLPHYARLVATLSKYMPDVGSELISNLEEDFRYLQRKKNVVQGLLEVRLKNLTFLSELTKFGIVPPHLILHIFKVFLDDFSGVNIDNAAMLLEGCGRYLMKTDETKEKMSQLVEQMRRKQSMQHLDQRQILLLENAYYQCNPPERAPRQEKVRTPLELFIRHLVYDVLAKRTIDKVLKLMRKLDWNDPEVYNLLHRAFTKPWKLRYSNIGLLAMLTYDLQRYHPAFVIGVVDQVLEDIRRGMEQNLFKSNQRRVATMKYLGELYIYRLINSGLIFDTLWSLVTFGHPDGRPMPGQPSSIDAPDDFFRVRLVCILLDGCGMCFDKGSLQQKLDSFLTFFQLYVLSKEDLPMDVDFMLSDTLEELRPKLVLFKTFDEAARAVDDMFAEALKTAGVVGDIDESVRGSDDSGDEGDDRRDAKHEEEDMAADEDDGQERPASPDAFVLLSNSQKENLGPSEEADADFAKELAKMISDTSSDARKVDKKTALAMWDAAILPPTASKKKKEEEAEGTNGTDGDVMNFTVVSRRGNKPQIRQLPVPATSTLAVHTRSAQLQDKVEQQHLKKLVLDYEHREEIEEMKAFEQTMRNRGIRVKHS